MIILYFYFYNDFFVSIYDLLALLVEPVADVYYCQDHNRPMKIILIFLSNYMYHKSSYNILL